MLKDGKRKKILRTKKTHKKNIEEEDGLKTKELYCKGRAVMKNSKETSHYFIRQRLRKNLPKERKEHMPKQSQSNENAVSFIFLLY